MSGTFGPIRLPIRIAPLRDAPPPPVPAAVCRLPDADDACLRARAAGAALAPIGPVRCALPLPRAAVAPRHEPTPVAPAAPMDESAAELTICPQRVVHIEGAAYALSAPLVPDCAVYKARLTCSSRLSAHPRSVVVKEMSLAACPHDYRVRELEAHRALAGPHVEAPHPNIVRFYGASETADSLYIAMEHVRGVALIDHIPREGLSEDDARPFFRQLVSAVAYCHQHGFAHRDLKPENVLVELRRTPDLQATIPYRYVLADFGLAIATSARATTPCGTDGYVPPEVYGDETLSDLPPDGSYYSAIQADMWSLGHVLFFMVFGQHAILPGLTRSELCDEIAALQTDPHAELTRVLQTFTEPCQDLLLRLWSLDPTRRPSAEEVLRHPWVTGGARACGA